MANKDETNEIFDVRDIDTKCIPETMALAVERITYILERWLGFWKREIDAGDTADAVFDTVIGTSRTVGKIAHEIRRIIRVFIEDMLITFERNLAKSLRVIIKMAKGIR